MRKKVESRMNGRDHAAHVMEQLEPRALFSAPYDFAGVGIRFDAGPAVFLVEGEIAADGSMTGSMRTSTLAGGPVDSDLDWTRYVRGDRAALTFETRDGFVPYAQQWGTQFIREERWNYGAFSGLDANGMLRDFAVLSETYTPEDLRNSLLDQMQLQMTRLTAEGTETFSLTIMFDFAQAQVNEFTFVYHLPGGDVTATKQVQSVDGGRITMATGEVLILTGFRDGAFLADFDASDGIMGVAAGRMRMGYDFLNGRYTGAILTTGPESRSFFGVPDEDAGADGTAAANVVIEFQYNSRDPDDAGANVFFVYERGAWEAGMRTPVNTGTWVTVDEGFSFPSLRSTRIEMTDAEGRVVTARVGQTFTMWFDDLEASGGAHEELIGALEKQEFRFGNHVELLAETDADGHPIAYLELGQIAGQGDEGIFALDLVEEVGGEAVVGKLYVWSALASGGAYFIAGLSAEGDVQVWRWSSEVGWTYRNLTDTIEGAVPIASHFAGSWFETGLLYTAAKHEQALVGFDAEGNFVAYRQATGELLLESWEFYDAGEQGLGGEDTLPEIVTEFTGYGTGWNGHNFAGLDAAGQVWVVWWAPGLEQWQAQNLSAFAGIETLTGNLASLRTGWDTLHIVGTSAIDGHVIVAWWAPGFVQWEATDLTDVVGGPVLEAGTLTAHFSFGIETESILETINIVGKDLSGHTRIYWWAAYAGWHVAYLATASSPAPDVPWQFTSSAWLTSFTPGYSWAHSQSLLGRSKDGHLVRLVWRQTDADAWLFEDVSDIALSYFV